MQISNIFHKMAKNASHFNHESYFYESMVEMPNTERYAAQEDTAMAKSCTITVAALRLSIIHIRSSH